MDFKKYYKIIFNLKKVRGKNLIFDFKKSYFSFKELNKNSRQKLGLKKYYQKIGAILPSRTFFNSWSVIFRKASFFLKKYKVLIMSLLIAFFVSDLLLIKSYNLVIPNKQLSPLKLNYQVSNLVENREKYKILWEKNIFHTGTIPLILKATVENLAPVLSQLTLTLKGTIIHANPQRSVATIQSGYSQKTFSYQVGDKVDQQVQIREIGRKKVLFFNENNNRLEFILLDENQGDLDLSYQKEDKPKLNQNDLVKNKGKNTYEVSRSDINEHLKKLPEILHQARVVPHKEDGQIKGFRFESIDKGSIFENLGFEKGDIIKEVDGEFIENPDQAFHLYERLKGSSGFKVLVEKDGKDVELDYNVDENAPIL